MADDNSASQNGGKTLQDLLNEQNARPITGTPASGGTSLTTPSGDYIAGGDLQTIINQNIASQNSASNTISRVGDWVYKGYGKWEVVPNSETDINRRYLSVRGARLKQNLNIGDYIGAAASSFGTNVFSKALMSKGALKAVGGAAPILAPLAAAATFGQSLLDAEKRYLDDWLNQEVDYEVAGTYSTDDKGNRIFTPDLDKMKDAGYFSGSDVKKATDRTSTKAMVLGDNSLSINVSPVFANSERYADLLAKIRENLPSLTEEQANTVDKETGKSLIDKITDAVKAEEDRFYYNAQTFAALKQVAPTASDEALSEAADTQLIGNLDQKALESAEVTIYDADNNKQTVNAKQYLDSVKNMSSGERDDYMSAIGNKIKSANISDDEKAVLQAQANALYAASQNDGEYHGMYERGFLDAISDAPGMFLPRLGEAWNAIVFGTARFLNIFGVDTAKGEEVARNRRLSTYYDNELISPAVQGALSIGRMFAISRGTNFIEDLIRGNVSKIGGLIGGTVGGKIASAAAGGLPLTYQALADLPIELARSYAYSRANQEFDFKNEFFQDLVIDALFSYGPQAYVETVRMPKLEYRRFKGNKVVELDDGTTVKYKGDKPVVYDSDGEVRTRSDEMQKVVDTANKIYDDNVKDLAEDEFETDDLYPKGVGIREDAGLVEITAEELAQRRAKTLDKLTDSKLALKTMELFMDKNAAMAKLAVQVKAAGGSNYLYQKVLMYSNDIKRVTEFETNRFQLFGTVKQDWNGMAQKISEAVGRAKDFSKADRDYINASANRYRFLAENKGNKEAIKEIEMHYKPGIEGVSEERAAELEEVMTSIRKVVNDVFDFYVSEGVMTKEQAKKIRNLPAYKNGMFFPVWSSGAGVNGKWEKEIPQARSKMKKVFNKEELIALDDLEHPLVSVNQYIKNAMRNVALNNRAKAVREAALVPGVKIHAYSDTGGGLSEVENIKEMKSDFAKGYDKIVEEVKQEYPSHQQWQKNNAELVLSSQSLEKAQKLQAAQKEGSNLRRRRNKLEKSSNIDVVREGELVDDNGVKTKVVNIDGYNVKLDYEIADRIAAANNDGFETFNSHSGMTADHDKASDAGGGYIDFDGTMPQEKKDAIIRAAKKAGMGVNESNNPFYIGRVNLVVRQSNTADGLRLEDVIEMANAETVKKYNLSSENWVDDASQKGILSEALDYRSEAERRIYSEHGGYAQPDDESRRKSWDIFFEELGGYKNNLPDFSNQAKLAALDRKIIANKALQTRLINGIKADARALLEKAQEMSKGSPVELDIDSFVNVELSNALKKGLRANNSTGQIQDILSNAVQLANPYTPRNAVIKARTEEYAEKYRKRVNRHMKFKSNIAGKLSADHINATADKVFDSIAEKVVGKRNQVKAINDADLTRILNSHDPHTIRYMIDGKEERLVLTGNGSEALVQEFKEPEFIINGPVKQRLLGAARWAAQAKRYLTTSADPTRVLPNIIRDNTRGIVSTGGIILIETRDMETNPYADMGYDEATVQRIQDGWNLANNMIAGSTFTKSMQVPRKNQAKTMIRDMKAEDGNAYIRFKAKTTGEKLSMLQDMGEEFTRARAMDTAYQYTFENAIARGADVDRAINEATYAAVFAGTEATTNFFRRGKFISQIAQMVPYLSQKFATLESFKYSYLNDPIAVGRALHITVNAYAALIAIALSNEESRKKYFMLTEYDRSNNIIIPLTNDMIMTLPLDETIAAFLTPYRRAIETLNNVDPEAFYLWGADFLEALSPLDLTGFSEGDKFNVQRGFEKLGSQLLPTWALPIMENITGRDWYYGSDIRADEEYVGSRTGNYTPTAGEMTTKSANSRHLAAISNATGIPQWQLQRYVSEYFGNVSQYVLNTLDKLSGATDEAQGGKEFFDSIFKPFTGMDSDAASSAFWDGVKILEEKKKRVQNEIRTLNGDIASSASEEKIALQKKRQEKISKYGTDITDFVSEYLSAYEITGGLTKQQANRIWRLYQLYDSDKNQSLYDEGSVEEYYSDKAQSSANKKATNLAGGSGIDAYVGESGLSDYDTYAMQALKNTIYGVPTQQMVDIANILEDTSNYENSFKNLRSKAYDATSKAANAGDWDAYDKAAYQYDYKVLAAIYPYLVKNGVADTLNNSQVMKYLKDWIIVPTSEMRTSKGRYVPNLGVDSQKSEAFKKQFIKKMFGVSGE